jgi:multidrug efflux pump subunit AcrA (membrane-fusion protein)
VKQGLKIPTSAVLAGDNGAKSVMVVGADGKAHRKAVTLGIQDGDDVQITQGVTAGDMVITTGSYGLDDGAKVKVGPADEDEAKPAAGKGGDKD